MLSSRFSVLRSDLTPLVLGLSVAVLGVLGSSIVAGHPWGLGGTVWLSTLSLVAVILSVQRGTFDRGRWPLAGLVVLAPLAAWRAAPGLGVIGGLAIGTALVLGVRQVQQAWRPSPEGRSMIRTWIDAWIREPLRRFADAHWRGWMPPRHVVGGVFRGLLAAVPLLVIFGGLLALGDAAFRETVRRLFSINVTDFALHVGWSAVFAWVAAGYLGGMTRSLGGDAESEDDTASDDESEQRGGWVGIVEVSTVLGLVDALFAWFLVSQAAYLFGGSGRLDAVETLTVAEYARNGFFELVVVATMSLGVLLAARFLVDAERPRDEQVFRFLAGVQVVLLVGLLTSAAQRMALYLSSFGLTVMRLYVSVFLVWLLGTIAWFGWTVLRDRARRFLPGAAGAGIVMVVLLHAANPHGLVVRTNLARAQQGHDFDAAYATSLSADAIPALLKAAKTLDRDNGKEKITHHLVIRHEYLKRRESSWQSWNWSRTHARHLLDAHRPDLNARIAQWKEADVHAPRRPSPK